MKLTTERNYHPHNLDTAELASCYAELIPLMQYLNVFYWP